MYLKAYYGEGVRGITQMGARKSSWSAAPRRCTARAARLSSSSRRVIQSAVIKEDSTRSGGGIIVPALLEVKNTGEGWALVIIEARLRRY